MKKKHFFWERRMHILGLLKSSPMLINEVLNNLTDVYICERDTLHSILLTLVRDGCARREMKNNKVKWFYIKDLEPIKKTKREIQDDRAIVPESVWRGWKFEDKKIEVKPIKKEPITPMYMRSDDDIKAGIYRSENRKGKWQPDRAARGINTIRGNSFNSGAW